MLKKILELLIFIITLAMGFYFQWEIANFIFFAFFVFLILHPIPSRFAFRGAAAFLLIAAVFLFFKKNDWMETIALWAYYLMIFTATLSFGELQKQKERDII